MRYVTKTLVLAFCVSVAAGELPAPLVKAHHARLAPKTAYLRYELTTQTILRSREKTRWVARSSGPELFLRNEGDQDEIRLRQPDGTPLFGVRGSCLPQQSVLSFHTRQIWTHIDNHDYVSKSTIDAVAPFVDPRSIGLFWQALPYKSPRDHLESLQVALKQTNVSVIEKAEGSNLRITMIDVQNEDDKDLGVSWLIDPQRQYSILSIELFERDKKDSQRTICVLTADHELINGYWWPMRVECHCLEAPHYLLYEVLRVEFDRKEHPRHIDADLLEIPPGTGVYGGEFAANPNGGRYIGGGQAVAEAEWEQIKENYDLETHTAWARKMLSSNQGEYPAWWQTMDDPAAVQAVATKPGEWEMYVRRWIIKRTNGELYKLVEPLSEKQKSAALSILEDCRKRAIPIDERGHRQLFQARENLKTMKEKNMPSADSTAAIATLQTQIKSLEAGDPRIAEIYQELKNRLDGLLTSKQRSTDNVIRGTTNNPAPVIRRHEPALKHGPPPPSSHPARTP